ncbi:MAG: HAMP domain-containing sensor histidine kinase [Candidatus Paceibacterota bacterium]|jgi:signal transduction histidine kinase
MDPRKPSGQFNILGNCKKYGLSTWQCPQFLFLVMGFIIITSEFAFYFLGSYYIKDPRIVILAISGLTGILFIIAFTITKGFENLAESNRMKSEFIGVVSHQLRAPLSNMSWTIDLIMSGRLGKIEASQLEYFKILKENNGRMKDLVSNLLIVSRLQSANLILKNKVFSFEELFNDIAKSFGPYIKASNIEVETNIEKDLPRIFASPDQIKMVVENLLDNAVRYTQSKGKIAIIIKKNGDNVYFSIKDNGVGVPQGDQKYLFQKFFRSENAMKRQTQGSGLGLYIAKSIIEKSKGKMGFSSQENVGTTFWFTLPTKNQ